MNGIIIINKQKEYTSHDVVSIVKKILKTKVGHAGTLDPNATGVLPLLLGKGTLLSKYLINHDKTYEVILRLGIATNTQDATGDIIEEREVNINNITFEKIEISLKGFIGKTLQTPPMYSAIKVDGKKLYQYARQGKSIEVEPRQIEIYNIELKNIDNKNNEIKFTVECSKGTYIRTLCVDIAKAIGTIGHMKELNRTRVGIFDVSQAITLDDLKQHKEDAEYINSKIISIEELFRNKERLVLTEQDIEFFSNGVQLNCINHKIGQELKDDTYRIYDMKENFIGLGTVEENTLKRDVIL